MKQEIAGGRTVTARFPTEAEAEGALANIASRTALADSAVLSPGVAATLMLDSLDLDAAERSACRAELEKGGVVLIAQGADAGSADRVLGLLQGTAGATEPRLIQPASGLSPAAHTKEASAEERIPMLSEELRIGKRETMRGGARVRSFLVEVPVQEEIALLEERTSVEHRPVNRRLTPEEVVQGGLLKDRVIEVAQMREEAVVSKEVYVREEVVISKTVEQRIERINETVRRTEIEMERLPHEANSGAAGFQPPGG